MTLNDVNNAASTKSGSDRTGPDRIGLFISVCGYYVIQHLVFGFRQKFKRDFQIFSGLSSI